MTFPHRRSHFRRSMSRRRRVPLEQKKLQAMKKKKKVGSQDLVAAGLCTLAGDGHPHIGAAVDAATCLHRPLSLPAVAGAAVVAPRAHTVMRAHEDVKKNEDPAATVMSSKSLGRRGPVTVPVSRATPTALEAVGRSVETADANVLGLHKWMAFVPVVASPL